MKKLSLLLAALFFVNTSASFEGAACNAAFWVPTGIWFAGIVSGAFYCMHKERLKESGQDAESQELLAKGQEWGAKRLASKYTKYMCFWVLGGMASYALVTLPLAIAVCPSDQN